MAIWTLIGLLVCTIQGIHSIQNEDLTTICPSENYSNHNLNSLKITNVNYDGESPVTCTVDFMRNVDENILVYWNLNLTYASNCAIDIALYQISSKGDQTSPLIQNLCSSSSSYLISNLNPNDTTKIQLELNEVSSTIRAFQYLKELFLFTFLYPDGASGECMSNYTKCSVKQTNGLSICIDSSIDCTNENCPLDCISRASETSKLEITTLASTAAPSTQVQTSGQSSVSTNALSSIPVSSATSSTVTPTTLAPTTMAPTMAPTLAPTTIAPTTISSTAATSTNATTAISLTNAPPRPNRRFNVFLAVFITLAILMVLVVALWIYGKRKRRWREFLAQLDSNTDWDYEQLDDEPVTPSVSRHSMVQQVNFTSRTINDVNLMDNIGATETTPKNEFNQETVILNMRSQPITTVNERTPIATNK